MTPKTSNDEPEIPDWIEFARQSFENDLTRLMAKKEMRRKDLAAHMGVTPAHITQTLGRRNNYQLSSLVKLARGVGAVLEIRLADETSEVVRVLDVATARYVDNHLEHVARIKSAPTGAAGKILAWRVEDYTELRSFEPAAESDTEAKLEVGAGAGG